MDKKDVNVEQLCEEICQKFEDEHTAKISLKWKHTFISYQCNDYIVSLMTKRLEDLLRLMQVDFARDRTNGFQIIIDGEDVARAKYIQKFIDNGYVLSWE